MLFRYVLKTVSAATCEAWVGGNQKKKYLALSTAIFSIADLLKCHSHNICLYTEKYPLKSGVSSIPTSSCLSEKTPWRQEHRLPEWIFYQNARFCVRKKTFVCVKKQIKRRKNIFCHPHPPLSHTGRWQTKTTIDPRRVVFDYTGSSGSSAANAITTRMDNFIIDEQAPFPFSIECVSKN